ncbi:MAG: 30S ribosome-binding factor RbfA [Planctomycetota bacterium]
MSHRIEQIESTLHRVLAEVLQRSISDPRIEGLVSITKVKVSDDMAAATVFVSVLPAEKQRTTVKGLEHAAVHIHGLAKKKLALRRVPRLTFRGDDELKKQDQTLRAIREAMDRSGPGDEGGDAPPDETTIDDPSVAPGVGRAGGAEDHA